MNKITKKCIAALLPTLTLFSTSAQAENISIKTMQTIADQVKKQLNLPKKLDNETMLIDIVPSTNRLIYHYTLINYDGASIDAKVLYDTQKPIVTKNLCKNPAMIYFRDNNISTEYIYFGKDKAAVTAVLVSPNDCTQIKD